MTYKKGFTLIEVMVAVVLTALSFVILSYLANSLRSFQVTQAETQAASFARSYVDLVKSNWSSDSGYTQTLLPHRTPPGGFSYQIQVQDAISNAAITSYSYSTTVPTATLNNAKLRNVSITVSNSKGTQVQLVAQVSRSGLR